MGGKTAVLMDMPERPDGPTVKNGKPYSAIAHLAENINAVLAVNSCLAEQGYSAPQIFAAARQGRPRGHRGPGLGRLWPHDAARRRHAEPLDEAVRLLADMARQDWPAKVAIPDNGWHHIPPYDREAMTIEVELLLDWFWPLRQGLAAFREGPRRISWRSGHELLPLAEHDQPVWTLRDFHSPNLIWLPERRGFKRVGLIDTQDCVLGHPAYDLASLLQDARVDVDFVLADTSA